jgi:hypothetical protein
MVPVPKVASMAALNEIVAAGDERDDHRHIEGRRISVGEHFSAELVHLGSLPDERFDTALALNCRVDTKSRICVRQSFYSVPVRYAGRRLDVRLGADQVSVLDGSSVVARHARAAGKGSEILELDHYLEVLSLKPGALAGASALVAARRAGAFGPTHQQFWDLARRAQGDGAGTRSLIAVLLLHRTMTHAAVVSGLARAIEAGSLDPEVVAVEARRSLGRADVIPVISESLAAFDRPAPTLGSYDDLLDVG